MSVATFCNVCVEPLFFKSHEIQPGQIHHGEWKFQVCSNHYEEFIEPFKDKPDYFIRDIVMREGHKRVTGLTHIKGR